MPSSSWACSPWTHPRRPALGTVAGARSQVIPARRAQAALNPPPPADAAEEQGGEGEGLEEKEMAETGHDHAYSSKLLLWKWAGIAPVVARQPSVPNQSWVGHNPDPGRWWKWDEQTTLIKRPQSRCTEIHDKGILDEQHWFGVGLDNVVSAAAIRSDAQLNGSAERLHPDLSGRICDQERITPPQTPPPHPQRHCHQPQPTP